VTAAQRVGLELLVENGPAGAVSARGNGHGFISTRVARQLVERGFASTTDEISYTITSAGLRHHARERIDTGDWRRAAGDAICDGCGAEYHQHADVQGYATFRVICGGEVVKL